MKERISVNPNIHFGKPCVAGTRITVQNVLELIREGVSFEEIIQDYYPDLEAKDIQACIQYAIDILAAEDVHISVEVA
ncbi:antitoxin [candidate division KSB1 bacterium RBG_16_48_16]|nr:MAG: antitoxin [candidate division KSB1 bacterium RBG_16_48_16]